MPLNVLVRTDVKVEVTDEETLAYLLSITQNAHPQHHDNGEPEHIRLSRQEIFDACKKALDVIKIGDQYDNFSPP